MHYIWFHGLHHTGMYVSDAAYGVRSDTSRRNGQDLILASTKRLGFVKQKDKQITCEVKLLVTNPHMNTLLLLICLICWLLLAGAR